MQETITAKRRRAPWQHVYGRPLNMLLQTSTTLVAARLCQLPLSSLKLLQIDEVVHAQWRQPKHMPRPLPVNSQHSAVPRGSIETIRPALWSRPSHVTHAALESREAMCLEQLSK